jgi:EAL domain-containing protein (putative c-di-GMP-specific phosphodiesterase class I)/GGDEF domain-containing protein
MRSTDLQDRQQPDLVAVVGRDGTLHDFVGGSDLPDLRPSTDARGKDLSHAWDSTVARTLIQCTRKAIAVRGASEAQFEYQGRRYEVRATARGPDRATCHIRLTLSEPTDIGQSGRIAHSRFERRGFLRRFQESMAMASLADQQAAVAVLQIDSAADLAQSIDLGFAEKVVSHAIRRLDGLEIAADPQQTWYMGQLGQGMLIIVFESGTRESIEEILGALLASLREPVLLDDLEVHLNPHCGAALLGRDASSAKLLLDCARSAAAEARRANSTQPHFFSDTLRLRSITRIDMARELREAISDGSIGLRYMGRHDLLSGRLHTCVAYLRWQHPLRGEVPPAEFLRLAETTGLAEALSRRALECLQADFKTLGARVDESVRFSFGGLRNHILSTDFVAEIESLIETGALPADRLELRVSERSCLIREPEIYRPLTQLGVRMVVDEVGRDAGALRRLASAPLWGLQLDRAWAASCRTDPTARKLCRAFIGMAKAFDLTPIATAVDDEDQRRELTSLGCVLGQGDLFAAIGLSAPAERARLPENKSAGKPKNTRRRI